MDKTTVIAITVWVTALYVVINIFVSELPKLPQALGEISAEIKISYEKGLAEGGKKP